MTRLALVTAIACLAFAAPLDAGRVESQLPTRIGTLFEGNLVGSGTATGRFTLDLGASSTSGKLSLKYKYGDVQRSDVGQTFIPTQLTETLRAKGGTLVIRSIGREVPVGFKNPLDPDGDSEAWSGTWSIVRGTGKYTGYKGGGDGAGLAVISGRGLRLQYVHRYEGTVTTP